MRRFIRVITVDQLKDIQELFLEFKFEIPNFVTYFQATEKLKRYLDSTNHVLIKTNELGPDSDVQNPFEEEHYFEFVIQDLYDGRITKIYL